jgi:aminoglycoside phosphotransferase (APT) family kinase protein
MSGVPGFDPNVERSRCEAYLSRALGGQARLVGAEALVQSTRAAPWRLGVELDGVARSYVLRLDEGRGEHEYHVLRAMESIPIPTPRAYRWDPQGAALGVPCFVCDFVAGESLLPHMLAGEAWAEALYIDTACALQAVTWEQVARVARRFGDGETAEDVLERSYEYFRSHPHPLAEAVYARLKGTMPALPALRFSNGDLYPDNLIVCDRQLVGVIDFENAGFSDPIYEFLLPFFVCPELRGRGTEERYCRRMGFDPDSLHWYHGLEYLETWCWVLETGKSFVQHTAESLSADLTLWLDQA